MSNEADVYRTAMAGYQSALVQEEAAYRQAQLAGDFQESVRASQAMASYRAAMNEYHNMAAQHAASTRAAAPSNKYGLTEEEVDIALKSVVDRDDLVDRQRGGYRVRFSDEDKLRSYAENKAKLAQMRRDGRYVDQVR